jgi:hypothetical protein
MAPDPPNNRLPSGQGAQSRGPNLWRALAAIVLVFAIVLINLGIYVATLRLIKSGYMDNDSVFPAIVLFLSFTLSVGIILVVGLDDWIGTANVQNPLIRQIGVTRVMVVVAVIASLFLTPVLKNVIFPSIPVLQVMLANVGVTCLASEQEGRPQASRLLAVISADEDYINKVKDFLKSSPLKAYRDFKMVDPQQDADDQVYKLLRQYTKLDLTLGREMKDPTAWMAYSVQVSAPNELTQILLPTIYKRDHTSRLFLIVTDDPTVARTSTAPEPERGSLKASVSPVPGQRILPLLEVDIMPEMPVDQSQQAKLNIEIVTGHKCWQAGV